MNKEIISYDALWHSMKKCQKGVMWKPSVKSFVLNGVENIHRMENQLNNGTWKNGKPKAIKILYPKKRDGLSITFKDRVYQRSINDNVLYPNTSRTFIFDNCACQKGKGTSFARRRIKEHLWNYYCHYGCNGYVLQIDIHGYYPSMRHDVVKDIFKRYIDEDTHEMVCDVLDYQYSGDIGYNPGSQMVQIAGITVPNDLDHYCKEKLHIKHYIRYMDDFWILSDNRKSLEFYKTEIVSQLNSLGFEINEKKTVITPLSKGFLFLGFHYKLTSTGKIVMTLNSASIKHERKKLYRLVKLAKDGIITRDKVYQCYESWKVFANEGNSYKLLKRMDKYLDDLWRDVYENFENKNDS